MPVVSDPGFGGAGCIAVRGEGEATCGDKDPAKTVSLVLM